MSGVPWNQKQQQQQRAGRCGFRTCQGFNPWECLAGLRHGDKGVHLPPWTGLVEKQGCELVLCRLSVHIWNMETHTHRLKLVFWSAGSRVRYGCILFSHAKGTGHHHSSPCPALRAFLGTIRVTWSSGDCQVCPLACRTLPPLPRHTQPCPVWSWSPEARPGLGILPSSAW